MLVGDRIWSAVLLFASIYNAAFAEITASNDTKHGEIWNNPVGRMCMTVEHFRPVSSDNSSFYECATLTEEERKEYGIEGKYLGLWTKRSCSNDSLFETAKQKCVEKKRFHRQQSLCADNPGSLGCGYVCPASITDDPRVGTPCTWQQSRLYNDLSNDGGFLQCVATSATDPCGEWSRVDCPLSTTFKLTIQICVPVFTKNAQRQPIVDTCTAPNEIAVCRCGSSSNSCPGVSVCQNGYCCASVDPTLVYNPTLYPQFQAPICIGSGAYPISSCSIPCPPQYTCQPSVGCCPVVLVSVTTTATPTTQAPKMILVQLATCPGTNTPPVSSCGSCPVGYTCAPLLGACCPAPPTTAAPPPQPVIILCPKTNTPPQPTCSPCPAPSYVCIPTLGCCPVSKPSPTTTMAPPASPPQIILLCPGTNTPPRPIRNPYPSPNFICTPIGCCPFQKPPPTRTPPTSMIPATIYLACPNGNPPTQQCAPTNPCPPTNVCIHGRCCPCQCPSMSIPVSVCPAQQSSPALGPICVCTNGCCCQQTPAPLPTCSNGQIAVLACTSSNQCGIGQECSSGGCCPIPFCPSGIQASGHCSASSACQGGTVCLDGLCCALPVCPSGQVASTFCIADSGCGLNQRCFNGGCCSSPPIPIPLCPSGVIALVPCASACTASSAPSCCPANTQCVIGTGCCPQLQQLPICPTSNQLAVTLCTPQTQCPVGTECNTVINACCPLQLCPSGAQALHRCNIGCPSGTTCINSLCCPVPTTVHLPVCMNTGEVATVLCGPKNVCPPDYVCTPEGGCCQLATDMMCPMNNLPICLCSPTGTCPDNSFCFHGVCCSTPTVFTTMPGTECEASPQCAGYPTGAQCLENLCVCGQGSYSNGAACVVQQPMVIQTAQDGCDQYGSPCRYVLSSVRRRPMLSVANNRTTDPLWFNVLEKRKCPRGTNESEFNSDNTCLPNEKCVDGICKPKLWVGEYGCDSDLQCRARCPNSYCESKSDKGIPQCQCSNGLLLLYGRCFEVCPKGFHESGGYCQHEDEELFWKNSSAQAELQNLLDKGTC